MTVKAAGVSAPVGVCARACASLKERRCEPFKSRHVLSIKTPEPNNGCQVATRTLTHSLLVCDAAGPCLAAGSVAVDGELINNVLHSDHTNDPAGRKHV